MVGGAGLSRLPPRWPVFTPISNYTLELLRGEPPATNKTLLTFIALLVNLVGWVGGGGSEAAKSFVPKCYHRGNVCKEGSRLGNVRSLDFPRAVSLKTTVFCSHRAIIPGMCLSPCSRLPPAQTSVGLQRKELARGRGCGLRKCTSLLVAFWFIPPASQRIPLQ